MTDFTMKKDADGVAVITWDVPGKSMNVLSLDGAATLSGLIDDALADASVKGIVITSGKKDFAGGMDLNVIAGMKQGGAQAVFDGVLGLHHLLRKIDAAVALCIAVGAALAFENAVSPEYQILVI